MPLGTYWLIYFTPFLYATKLIRVIPYTCFKRMNTHLNRAGELHSDEVLISPCEPISGHRLDLVSYTALLTSHYGVYHLFIDLHDF